METIVCFSSWIKKIEHRITVRVTFIREKGNTGKKNAVSIARATLLLLILMNEQILVLGIII